MQTLVVILVFVVFFLLCMYLSLAYLNVLVTTDEQLLFLHLVLSLALAMLSAKNLPLFALYIVETIVLNANILYHIKCFYDFCFS